ncbi:MAG: glycine cleavage system aminomethyltransferase GcvT [Trueperaceae bacterium]|nr:glycine cleavage system aminomethyltransferase GcvT [Trueperaceae bacterium]
MKQTPLYNAHVALGARMVDFAGWKMPIQYQGIKDEHLAVRRDCGLFDVSHMGEITVSGPAASGFLRYATLNDPAKLQVGRAQYSMLPNDRGGLVDDLYIYRRDETEFLVVCNAANIAAVVAQLVDVSADYDVTVEDVSSQWGLLALQGPNAASLLAHHCKEDLSDVKKNRVRDVTVVEQPVIIARTGYTGEDGFELFCLAENVAALWNTLVNAGATPCGLGARDTLRLEAGFPLFGHDLSGDTNPLCTTFSWVVKDKPFYGREAMWDPQCERRLVGLVLQGRGVPREGYRVCSPDGAEEIGAITSGTVSPLTKRAIALAWVDSDYSAEGCELAVEIRNQLLTATVTAPPFYD